MRLKYSSQILNLYCKQTGCNLSQLSEKIGIGYSTLNRFARDERLPDIQTLLRICNTLHIRVNNFFVHPDVEPTEVRIYEPEEWSDIRFRYDRIEAIRLNRQLSKEELIRQINNYAGCKTTRNTYNNLINGTQFSYIIVYGLIGSQDVELDYLFEQKDITPDDESVVISRKQLTEMKSYIARLENAYRELEVKNKRLEKRVLPRYEERRENIDAKKIIRNFVRNVERNLAELRSWTDEEENFTQAPSVPYGETEDRTLSVAERKDF